MFQVKLVVLLFLWCFSYVCKSVSVCVPFSMCVFKFPKCRLFLLSRRSDHSGFSERSQTRPHGFPLGLAVLTLPGMPVEGWERMREQSHRCWNRGGGGVQKDFCACCFSPRGWFGIELGPSLNWPQMVESVKLRRWQASLLWLFCENEWMWLWWMWPPGAISTNQNLSVSWTPTSR